MFKLNQLIVGIFLFLSSLFSCQQKGDFQSMNVEEFDSLIQNEDIQRLDVRTLAEYSEGHITKTININVMDDSFASMADSLLQKDKPVAVYCRSGNRSKKAVQQEIRMAGIGGKVEFMCGEDVAAVFLDMAENYRSTAQDAPIGIKLGDGEVRIGSYVIRFMDETYPAPMTGEWVPKLDAKTLMGVAVDVPGTIWYCAIDSISANNAAVPLHIVPVKSDDDTSITLIGQAKPMPARPSRAVCKAVVVA